MALVKPTDWPVDQDYLTEETESYTLADAECFNREDLQEINLPSWCEHNADFIRAALHLHHRATRAGYDIPLTSVVHACEYEISPISRYAAVLQPELQATAPDTLILDLVATDPPAAFAKLWCDDVRNWLFVLRRREPPRGHAVHS